MDRRTFLTGGAAAVGSGALGLTLPGDKAFAGPWTNPQVHTYAMAQSRIGAPYVYGAAGDWAFDCSGLIMWSVKKATNFVIQRQAQAQVASNAASYKMQSVGSPAVGDLVYFYGYHGGRYYWYHCGFYAGGGRMLNAPDVGQKVSYTSVNLKDARGRMAARRYYRITQGTVDYWNGYQMVMTHQHPYHYNMGAKDDVNTSSDNFDDYPVPTTGDTSVLN